MASIAMVGDIFLQEHLRESAALAEVVDLLQSADIAFGNLETPVSERGSPIEKWVNMLMPPALLTDVMDLGFQVVTLANNHMMDYGEVAFKDTLTHLDSRELAHVGAGLDLDAAWRAEILEVGNSHIAFLGAASTLGPGSAATKDRPGVAPIHVSEAYSVDPAASMEQPGSAPYVSREPGKKTWTAQQKPSLRYVARRISLWWQCTGVCHRFGGPAFRMD